MMTLYRSIDECPKLPREQHEAELIALEKERDSGPPGEYMVDAFNRMGKEKYVRYVELRDMIVNPQFFCDSQAQLLAQTGNNQFMVVIQVPDAEVFPRAVGREEVVASDGKYIENAGNYRFTGKELAASHETWRYRVRDMHTNTVSECPIW